MRLNKLIAKHQNCTRKEADNLIKNGLVTVNGRVAFKMGITVKKEDEIIFNKKVIKYHQKHYILLNKPKKYSCFNINSHTKKLLPKIYLNELDNYEQLDFNETGLTIFSNDNSLLDKIKKSQRIKKIYHIKLTEMISPSYKRNFFPWGIFFADVFYYNNGFDIVIANPHYISTKESNIFH